MSETVNKKKILITGGNRGIGKGLVAGLCQNNDVFFSVRDEKRGLETIKALPKGNTKFIIMDVDSEKSVASGIETLKKFTKKIDILINNAGVLISGLGSTKTCLETGEEEIIRTFNTNTLGVLRVIKNTFPLMRNGARIINISSGMGQLEDMQSGHIAYRLSKVSLNALSVILSKEFLSKNIKVNTICPGWVKTDMGGDSATLTVEESTDKIIEFAFKRNFPNGKFLRHGIEIPW